MWPFIANHLHLKVRSIVASQTALDTVVFMLNEHGNFMVRDFVAPTRRRGVQRRRANWIWKPCLPPYISSFLWRLSHHALVIDSQIQTKGIVLASRYRCCHNHGMESLLHLFIRSEVACAVWKCFGEMFGLLYRFYSIIQAMAICMSSVSESLQYGVVRLGVAAYIFRDIGVVRCCATFEGSTMHAHQICLKVLYRVQSLNLVTYPKQSSSRLQNHVLDLLGISTNPTKVKRGKWCKFEKPSPGGFKLNIDGLEQEKSLE